MKTFYTILLSAFAGTALAGGIPASPTSAYGGQMRLEGLMKSSKTHLSHDKKGKRAPMKRFAAEDLIYDAPGAEKVFFRNVEGFGLTFFGEPDIYTFSGIAQKLRFDGDDVYMYSPVSSYPTETWIKGKVTDDGMTFPLPQPILREYDPDPQWGYEQIYELNVLQLYQDDEEGGIWYDTMEDDLPNAIELKRLEDGSYGYEPVMMTCYNSEYDVYYEMPKYLVAVTTSWDPDFYYPEWNGYGDFYDHLIPFDGTPVTAPEGLALETWTVVSEGAGYETGVGFDGDDIYFKGLFKAMPDAWVKGTVKDGKVTIPCGQFVGINETDNIFCFFFAGIMDHWFDEDLWAQHFEIDLDETGVLEYDEAAKRMTTDQGFVLFTSEDAFIATDYVQTPTIMMQPADISKVPSVPVVIDTIEFGHWGDYAMVEFITSTLNDEGYWLGPSSDFSYRLISDGEPVIFTPGEDYPAIEEDMEWIPYDFTDDWSVMLDPYVIGDYTDHIVSYHVESKVYTAIQARYVDPTDSKEYLSEPSVFWGEDSGAEGVAENSGEAEYFNLQGIRVSVPGKGLYIVRKAGKASKVVR